MGSLIKLIFNLHNLKAMRANSCLSRTHADLWEVVMARKSYLNYKILVRMRRIDREYPLER